MKVIFENTDIWGFEGAIRGMRNPLNSWKKSDSEYQCANFCDSYFVIGDTDMSLAKRLIKAGNEHAKFMRMIHVQTDLICPRSLWQEIDTYKFGTKNSCSTMHKLLNTNEPITLSQFDWDEGSKDLWDKVIETLERFRQDYKNADTQNKKNEILAKAKMILPEGYLQRRTWDTNYAELRNIYFQRRNHRLPHWKEICKWIETLPYSELITYEDERKNENEQ